MQNDHGLALRISGVTKEYRLGQIGTGTLYRDLQSWFARARGKEDPNQKIGHAKRLVGDSFMALNGIDLEVKKGEALGIIGANGAGKSTLLKLLSQVTGPTSGTIELFGRVSSMLEVGTGFNGEMTGRENIYMNGAILGMTKAEISAKMEDIIEFSEVRDFIDTPVKRYSSGMYVKLAFSVAAHLDSEIMIMDEVLAVGDVAFQNKCIQKMKQVAQLEGRTVLYVSHNMTTIRQLCTRCIVLRDGKIVFDGDVDEAIKHYLSADKQIDYPVQYNYATLKRDYHFGEKIKMKSFCFLNKEMAVYNTNEKVSYEVVFDSLIEISNVCFVMRIRDQYYGEKYASSICKPFDVRIGKNQRVRVVMDINGIVAGKYSFSLEMIVYDMNGNYVAYDNPAKRMPVQIVDTNVPDIRWSTQYWGNIRLPDADSVIIE